MKNNLKAALLIWLLSPVVPFVPSSRPDIFRQSPELLYKNGKDTDLPVKTAEGRSAKEERLQRERQNLLDDHVNKVSTVKKFGIPLLGDKSKSVVTMERVLGKHKDDENLQKRLEHVLGPRPYTILALEKAAQLLEDTFGGLIKSKNALAATAQKEKLVVLGSGWGAASFLQHIDTDKFDVTVINPNVRYIEAAATGVDTGSQTLSCVSVECDDTCEIRDLELDYDRLVVAVGAQISTFGVPGVSEHCYFLKEIEDARRIRKAIVSAFDKASLPNLSAQEKEESLTFCVVGAGPTGVEFAAELRDFTENDGPRYYADLLKYVKIKIYEMSPGILRPFDESLQDAAAQQLTRESKSEYLPESSRLIELYLETGVLEVKEDGIILSDGKTVKCAFCVWAAGNGPRPITLEIIKALGEEQAATQDVARGRIAVDPWLRAVGGGGKILALGDNSCGSCNIQNRQLPATAQVAGQQAEHLARVLSSGFEMDSENDQGILMPPLRNDQGEVHLWERIAALATRDDQLAAPFQFFDMGILAYTGGESALAQVQVCDKDRVSPVKIKGKLGFGLWQSVYLMKQPSWKNRILLTLDWTKTMLFGRDITNL